MAHDDNDSGRRVAEGSDGKATASRPTFSSFFSFLRTSVPPNRPSKSSERTPLLSSDPEAQTAASIFPIPELEDDDDEAQATKLGCTRRGTLAAASIGVAIAVICAVAVYFGAVPLPGCSRSRNPNYPYEPRNQAYLLSGSHAAVASEDKTCSELGLAVIKKGGNAVDGAITANLCIGTLNMFSSGIGGGGFAIIRIPGKDGAPSEAFTIDFRETAPALANETMFGTNPKLPKFGGLAVATPGELRGLAELHQRWGRLPWKEVVTPVADLAMGWKVTAELARRFKVWGQFIPTDPDWIPVFAPNGRLMREGEPISRMAYSRTLRRIANEGPEVFYSGSIAESMVAKVQEKGGILTLEDIAGYKPIVRKAIEGSYLGRKVYTTSAPTSGPVVLNMLNVLEHYDLAGEGKTLLNVHRMIESMKFGFAARTRMADPAFLNDTEFLHTMTTKEYAKAIHANITDSRTHLPTYYDPMYDVIEDHGTTHTSVVDEDGLTVGITSTVNLIFGSEVHDPETGVIFNDQMDDFATYRTPNGFGLYPSPYNYPQPGKRPLSSIAPAILEHPDGRLHMILGGSGGSRIFTSIVQVILNVDWGMDISAAVEDPRVHDQLFPAYLSVESMSDAQIVKGLVAKGHAALVEDINLGVAEVQAILLAPNGTLFAASDSRKHGVAAAY
ncbi:hypothetical protein DL93DRAFT_2167881 [Clavulina sp. PMI_390]|nr:hypothetical protein DL93DRAFT_2167881 [Clavulina sp. PMI_390]